MCSGAEGSRGPGDLGFEPTEAERRTQVQILSLRLLGRGAESFRNRVFGVFFFVYPGNLLKRGSFFVFGIWNESVS